MGKYSESSKWSDIEPIPLDDGGSGALAVIAYSENYLEAMSYLRSIMAANEVSERALELTEDIISMNPAHYTVWLFRAKTVLALDKPIREEIEWLNPMAKKSLKNYQIWHHRQSMIDKLGDVSGETEFCSEMFKEDSKNFHVWTYRQWLVKRFDLWDKELKFCEEMIQQDVRNNSAWNHRWFVVFGKNEKAFEDEAIIQRELEYAQNCTKLAPQNASPWNYIKGLCHQARGPASLPLTSLKEFASQFASTTDQDAVKSSHALDLLASIYAASEETRNDAETALDLLAGRYDQIRAPYWQYRKAMLNAGEIEAAS